MFFRFNQLFLKLCVTWGSLLKRIIFTQQLLNDRAKQKGHWDSGSSRALSISALWMAETVTWLCIMLYFVLRQWRGVTSLRCSCHGIYCVTSILVYIIICTAYKTPGGTNTHSWAGVQNNVRPFEFSTFCGCKPQESNGYWDMMRPTANDTRYRIVKYNSMQLNVCFLLGGGGGG